MDPCFLLPPMWTWSCLESHFWGSISSEQCGKPRFCPAYRSCSSTHLVRQLCYLQRFSLLLPYLICGTSWFVMKLSQPQTYLLYQWITCTRAIMSWNETILPFNVAIQFSFYPLLFMIHSGAKDCSLFFSSDSIDWRSTVYQYFESKFCSLGKLIYMGYSLLLFHGSRTWHIPWDIVDT